MKSRAPLSIAILAATLVLLGAAAAPARADEAPLRDGSRTAAGANGLPALHQDLGAYGVFVPIVPCRVVDTRGNGAPIQGGAFGGGEARTYDFAGRCAGGNPSTSIPPEASALSLNVTVTQAAGPGFVLAYPAGGAQPVVSTVNYGTGQTIANAAIVPAGAPNGSVVFVAGVSGAHLIVDVNGYFTPSFNPEGSLSLTGSTSSGGATLLVANSTSADDASAVFGFGGGTPGGGRAYGVKGGAAGGPFSAGVRGYGLDFASSTYGVVGDQGTIQTPTQLGVLLPAAGVLGRGRRLGVHGISNTPAAGALAFGAAGCVKDAAGTGVLACGFAGQSDGTTTYGLYSLGNTGATGAKSFVEPHPTDPTKVIRYVALEGPEAGTYFRGKARVVDGVAVIEVPESFRLVSDADGLTVNVTPRGPAPLLYVESATLARIVVRAGRDVDFDFLVHGVRRSFRGWEPIAEGAEYRPAGPDATLPASLAFEQRKALVENGTYNEDGTVNLRTAERHGWTRAWDAEPLARTK